jgi:hypothetical protein
MQLVVSSMACDYRADPLPPPKRLPGVLVVTTELADQRITVRFAPEKVDPSMITAAAKRAGCGIVSSLPISASPFVSK